MTTRPLKHAEVLNPAFLVGAYMSDLKDVDDIAAETSISRSTVYKYLKDTPGVTIRPRSTGATPRHTTVLTYHYLLNEHVRKGRDAKDIGAENGIDRHTVGKYLKDLGLMVSPSHRALVICIHNRALMRSKTLEEVASITGHQTETVWEYLKRFSKSSYRPTHRSIPAERSTGDASAEPLKDLSQITHLLRSSDFLQAPNGNRKYQEILTPTYLYQSYVKEHRAIAAIAQINACPPSTVVDYLESAGIPRRRRGGTYAPGERAWERNEVVVQSIDQVIQVTGQSREAVVSHRVKHDLPIPGLEDALKPSDFEMLKLLVAGLSLTELAETLGAQHCRDHIASLCERFDVVSRPGLLNKSALLGLFEPHERPESRLDTQLLQMLACPVTNQEISKRLSVRDLEREMVALREELGVFLPGRSALIKAGVEQVRIRYNGYQPELAADEKRFLFDEGQGVAMGRVANSALQKLAAFSATQARKRANQWNLQL